MQQATAAMRARRASAAVAPILCVWLNDLLAGHQTKLSQRAPSLPARQSSAHSAIVQSDGLSEPRVAVAGRAASVWLVVAGNRGMWRRSLTVRLASVPNDGRYSSL